MRAENCIFCKLANGDIPTATLYEDDDFRVILDAGPAACPAAAGALLPGLRGAGRPDPGHGRGPHPGSQRGLDRVHGPGEPGKPLPLLPQPQNGAGTVAKPEGKAAPLSPETGPALGARASRVPVRRDSLHLYPRPRKFWPNAAIPLGPLFAGFSPHSVANLPKKAQKPAERS